jgi:hypothetical protein
MFGLSFLMSNFLDGHSGCSAGQAKEFRADAARGAKDGGHVGDTTIVSIGALILTYFVLSGLPPCTPASVCAQDHR